MRRRAGPRLETATHATSVWHWQPIERKPFYHFLPGTEVLTLASPGCSFTCHYCLNYRVSQVGRTEDAPWSAGPLDVRRAVTEAEERGAAIALSYTEPSLAAELTLQLAAEARPRSVPILWKSNGFLSSSALRQLAPALDAVNLDLKAADDRKHRALTGAPLAPIWDALEGFAAAGVWLEVSTPLVPGFCDSEQDWRTIAESIARIDPDIPWHLLRFTPDFRMRRARPTSPRDLERAASIGREAGLRHVYVERALGPEGRATTCQGCGRPVIRRGIASTLDVELEHGACATCREPIAGRWTTRNIP